jgi:integrase/recombinase XerC
VKEYEVSITRKANGKTASSYIDHLSQERRLSPLTCEGYRRDLDVLLGFAAETPLEQLQPHHIRRFVAQRHGKQCSGKTVARMLSAWRGFYRYLAKRHGYEGNPCAGIRAPKAPKSLPRALSPDEAAKLLDFSAADDVMALRDKALFELCYSSGLRLAELAGVKPDNLDLADGTVRITGKGGKTRIVPVGSKAVHALHEWIRHRENLIQPGASALFISRHGKNMSRRSISQRLKIWAAHQGISSNVHPHMLRHSFASHVLQSSGDLRSVQEMLGHSSISTTQIYTHLDFQHLSKTYDAAHPRARKKTAGT